MNWRAIRAVARKDLMTITRSKMVILPIILLPLIMLVIMPAMMGFMVTFLPSESSEELEDLDALFTAMPPSVTATFEGLNDNQIFIVLMLTYFFAPLYLIIPMMVSSVIAADSFAGEKERKTIEAFLYTPTTDQEMILGKMLAAWLPALAVSVGSFLLYIIAANAAAWPVMGRIFFPNMMWIILVFWVAPAASAVGLGMMVLVSSKVTTFQEANQWGGLVVLPLIGLVIGQISGLMFLSTLVAFALGLFLWAVAGALLWFAIHTFHRSELIAKL